MQILEPVRAGLGLQLVDRPVVDDGRNLLRDGDGSAIGLLARIRDGRVYYAAIYTDRSEAERAAGERLD